MQRVYRFEVIEERYRGPNNALLGARDSADGSAATLCEWTPEYPLPAPDAEKLADAAEALTGTEFFSAGPSFYLAARDDRNAATALKQFREQGWFSGQWPGLVAAPAEEIRHSTVAPVAPPAAAPHRPASKRPMVIWIVLLGSLFCSNLAWFGAYNDLQSRKRDEASANKTDLEGLQSKLADLQKKWDDRKSIGLSLPPLTLDHVELWNADESGQRIAPGSDEDQTRENNGNFKFDSLRYLSYRAMFRNNYLHLASVSAAVQVKFLKPDGTLMRYSSSPEGYSLEQTVVISEDVPQASIAIGWGNKDGGSYARGTHRLEFWTNGALIGTRNFTVY